MWANHEPRVNEDASQFNAASIDHARGHFKAWKIEQGKADDFPGYRLSVMIDEDCFQTLQNAPLSENLTTRLEDRLLHYVKISEGLEEEHEPPFPGWMTCSLPQMYPWMISGGIWTKGVISETAIRRVLAAHMFYEIVVSDCPEVGIGSFPWKVKRF